jgi:hypothetical protein
MAGQGDHHYGDGHGLAANPALASQLAAAAGAAGAGGYDPQYHQQMANGGSEMEGGQAHMEGLQGGAEFAGEGNGGMQVRYGSPSQCASAVVMEVGSGKTA